jgi:hypothetical protein
MVVFRAALYTAIAVRVPLAPPTGLVLCTAGVHPYCVQLQLEVSFALRVVYACIMLRGCSGTFF